MMVHTFLRVLQIHTSNGNRFSSRQKPDSELNLKLVSEPALAYLKSWIILRDLHNNIIRHLTAFIFYCYQSVVDKTWTISRMPCCSKYDQPITIQQQIPHHWEMIITYFTCSKIITQKKKGFLTTISTRYCSIFYSFRKKDYAFCSSKLLYWQYLYCSTKLNQDSCNFM